MLIGYKLLNYYFGTICDCIRRRLFSFIYLIFEVRIPVLWLQDSLRDLPGTWEEVLDANCCCASGPRPFSGTVPAAAGVAAATGEGHVCARTSVYPEPRHYISFFLAIRATVWLGSSVRVSAPQSSMGSRSRTGEKEGDVFAPVMAPAWLLRPDLRAPN